MRKIIIITLVVAALIATIAIVGTSALNQLNHVEIEKTDEALGISVEEKPYYKEYVPLPKEESRKDIINIALFGIDEEEASAQSRSDCMIILTIDFKNKKVKLSSLMRDMYVDIEDYGSTKLNHAYAYGGAPLAIKTINQNFGTNIRDYGTVGLYTLEKIIDVLGGVTIDVKEEEIPCIASYTGKTEITEAGEQLLNGNQAVAYASIRYVGNGDFERTERQRKVLSVIIDKAKRKGITAVPGLISEILPLVETSIDNQTILDMAVDYFKAGDITFEQERFPVDGYYWNDIENGIYYLKFDTEMTRKQITDYIYSDIKPIPKE